MRKFARSIGSEGKRHGQREDQCPLSCGRFAVVVLRFGALHSACDRLVCVKATFLRLGNRSPHGTLAALVVAKELPTQNCLRRGIQLYN
jgi:hypothetical protein